MEHQSYPVRHYTPEGDVIRPYDVTSWSLPLHRGLTSLELEVRSAALEERLEAMPEGAFDAPSAPGLAPGGAVDV